MWCCYHILLDVLGLEMCFRIFWREWWWSAWPWVCFASCWKIVTRACLGIRLSFLQFFTLASLITILASPIKIWGTHASQSQRFCFSPNLITLYSRACPVSWPHDSGPESPVLTGVWVPVSSLGKWRSSTLRAHDSLWLCNCWVFPVSSLEPPPGHTILNITCMFLRKMFSRVKWWHSASSRLHTVERASLIITWVWRPQGRVSPQAVPFALCLRRQSFSG